MFKLFMLTNFIVPLIEDIVALCFPQLDRKGLMYDPFGGRYVNVHEVFKLCAILKPPPPRALVENVNFLQNGNQVICTPSSAVLFSKKTFME